MNTKRCFRSAALIAVCLLIPALGIAQSNQYIRNQTTPQSGDFNISGDGQAENFAARSAYFLDGRRVLATNGDTNLFVGPATGGNLTSGANNTFVGHSSGVFNADGSFNTFLGTAAGFRNASGTGNSFVGFQAGFETVNGFENSFFGYRAGRTNTTGAFNVFLGTLAGFSNISGSDNVFVGGSAGRDTTIANFNSFFGGESGAFNTLGEENSFFGRQSGYGNTTGGRNAFFGNSAGFINTTGSNNTALGSLANFGSGSLTFATAIGANSVVTQSNTVQLGRIGLDVVRVGSLGGGGFTALCVDAQNTISFCSSSGRYKSKVGNYTSAFAILNRLQPISFEWEGGVRDLGLIAEEVAEIEPLLVTYNAKGEVEGVKYDRIGVVLINVIKEQEKKIAGQERELKDLKAAVCEINPSASVCRKGGKQ